MGVVCVLGGVCIMEGSGKDVKSMGPLQVGDRWLSMDSLKMTSLEK